MPHKYTHTYTHTRVNSNGWDFYLFFVLSEDTNVLIRKKGLKDARETQQSENSQQIQFKVTKVFFFLLIV